ncbi:MAG: hypothetical protein IT392_04105 [Nitrospirae bacterium]|nr:hypothetical protein [Nitrospirota bacterium]
MTSERNAQKVLYWKSKTRVVESMTKEQIRQTYDRIANWYDLIEMVPELLGVRRLRHEMLQRASGKVLEVAAGAGKNLRDYPRTCQIPRVSNMGLK